MGIVAAEGFLGILFFFFGASVFSFLNVIVYRVQKHLSFVKGHSFCPNCGHQLGVLDLIPVFSCLILRARCRYCGAKFGYRDTLVEIFGGAAAAFLAFYYQFDWIRALVVFAMACVLMVVTLFDMDTMEIPDQCSIAILVIAVVSIFVFTDITFMQRIIGVLCISVPMTLITLIIPGGFGGGDIKLIASAGLFLGWKLTLMAAFLGLIMGGVYGIVLLATKQKGRKEHFAFGPFLCAGIMLAWFFGQTLIDWYMSFLL